MTVLLRKLTLKSKLNFGKYSQHTVQRLIDLKGKKALNYLRRSYFYNSKISFTEEVLDTILEIKKIHRINKPGVEKNNKVLKELYYKDSIHGLKKEGILTKGIDYRKDNIKYSKQNLQKINHGKI